MTPTNGKTEYDEFAIYQAARELRARAFADMVGKAAAGIKGWVRRHVTDPLRARAVRQRQLEELMAMDEHLLRDLGLSRGGIAYAFEHGRDAEPANTNVPRRKTPHAA
jgi:uncharacterized protein YjiS (DUF1127 family)